MALTTKSTFSRDTEQRPFTRRPGTGDETENGIIRFVTPVLMSNFGGDVEVKRDQFSNALDQVRATYPIHKNLSGED